MATIADRMIAQMEEVPIAAVTNGTASVSEPPPDEIPDEAYEDEPKAQGNERRESLASELVKFIGERCELVRDEKGEVYAEDRQTRELRHTGWRTFKDWAAAGFFDAHGKALRDQSFKEALSTLSGLGRHRGELVEVHIRCAPVRGGYAIDMGEPGNSRAIIVEAGQWRIVDDPRVRFLRPQSLRPLPEPVRGGKLEELWDLLNIPQEARLLVLAWILDSWRPDSDFPVLELIGEHGSAKSLAQQFLARLVDPSSIEKRSAPKHVEDVYVGAGSAWVLAYDNLSHMSAELQDVFCRIATGSTFATRQFFTNKEESTIRAARPVCINSISAAITAQDLVDRAVSVELPTITARVEKGVLLRRFADAHPRLLGSLLDLFAAALALLPTVSIAAEDRPRMLEYAQLGCAIAKALGLPGEAFLKDYAAARVESVTRTIDASPVATALRDWLEGREDRCGEHSIKSLHETLKPPHTVEGWPRTPKGVGDALRRAAPALRMLGIHVGRGRQSHGQTLVRITKAKSGLEVSHPSHRSHPDSPMGHPQDMGR
jgi:hypothetical protein